MSSGRRPNSLVARSVGAPTYDAVPTLTCAYYTYWSGSRPGRRALPPPGPDDRRRADQRRLVPDHRVLAGRRVPAVRSDIEGHFLEALELAPDLARRVRRGTRSDLFRGTTRLPNFFRRPYGDGWALVGDAGHHKDPILALGITDAFRSAELLARPSTTDGGAGAGSIRLWRDYEARRNELAAPSYASTLEFARLQPPAPRCRRSSRPAQRPRADEPPVRHVRGTSFALGVLPSANLAQILGEREASAAVAAA
jgi:2-polyprenyl-6-methoxyphenol hydroxylase-like FAD-dependent oxidoreductase